MKITICDAEGCTTAVSGTDKYANDREGRIGWMDITILVPAKTPQPDPETFHGTMVLDGKEMEYAISTPREVKENEKANRWKEQPSSRDIVLCPEHAPKLPALKK